MITILYFAWLRERTGTADEQIELPDGVATVGALMRFLGSRHPDAFRPDETRVVRCAVNQAFAAPDDPVKDGDEVAFFPPVTGG
jgi:molybdopterin synthase sulfur carrier subunit